MKLSLIIFYIFISQIAVSQNTEDAIEETLQKELAKSNFTKEIIEQKSVDTYYLYIEESIFDPGVVGGWQKRTYYLSQPIPYNGDLDPLKERLTKDFEAKVQSQMPNFRQYHHELTFHQYDVNKVLKTKADCEAAIEEFKKYISDGWRGDTRAFKIIQL